MNLVGIKDVVVHGRQELKVMVSWKYFLVSSTLNAGFDDCIRLAE
jgi:hypothetical protein